MLRYAMNYGAILGLFWIFKYAILMLGEAYSDRFKYLFFVLNVGTFLLMYLFTYKYKESDKDHLKSTVQCILFTILLSFFASVFEGGAMYAHYKIIDPAYFSRMAEHLIEAVDKVEMPKSLPLDSVMQSKAFWKEVFSTESSYILWKFIENVILGAILGTFMAFTMRSRKK